VTVDYERLRARAAWVRQQVYEIIVGAGKGHIGGSLSSVDILVALYHGGVLAVDPERPRWPERDRFIHSKGHACEALYAVLADVGFFATDLLATYGRPGSALGGHVDNHVPGIEVSSGSLGHGLGIGAGLALAARLDGSASRTFVLLGDGECYEGSVWEAAGFAAHHGLDNLVAIVDRNGKITLDHTEECNRLEPFRAKWEAFGWDVVETDGHALEALVPLLAAARARRSTRPLVVVASTVKGKGVSFMETSLDWHHAVPRGADREAARRQLYADA
jgi:transketolase